MRPSPRCSRPRNSAYGRHGRSSLTNSGAGSRDSGAHRREQDQARARRRLPGSVGADKQDEHLVRDVCSGTDLGERAADLVAVERVTEPSPGFVDDRSVWTSPAPSACARELGRGRGRSRPPSLRRKSAQRLPSVVHVIPDATVADAVALSPPGWPQNAGWRRTRAPRGAQGHGGTGSQLVFERDDCAIRRAPACQPSASCTRALGSVKDLRFAPATRGRFGWRRIGPRAAPSPPHTRAVACDPGVPSWLRVSPVVAGPSSPRGSARHPAPGRRCRRVATPARESMKRARADSSMSPTTSSVPTHEEQPTVPDHSGCPHSSRQARRSRPRVSEPYRSGPMAFAHADCAAGQLAAEHVLAALTTRAPRLNAR